jgi:single-strand DNA-binding protein
MRNINNQVQLIGRAGHDVEVIAFEGGNLKAKVSLAVDMSYKDYEGKRVDNTQWFNVVAWNSRAEIFEAYVKKGDLILVSGSLYNRSYKNASGDQKFVTEVVVQEVKFLTPKEKSNPNQEK